MRETVAKNATVGYSEYRYFGLLLDSDYRYLFA
jgi:hypothetical protein